MGRRVSVDGPRDQVAPEVSVCVCTYHRPLMLLALLRSLAIQTLARNCMELVVVDNDPGGSAESVVNAFGVEHPDVPIRYCVEPRPGVSHARNRAVAEAAAPMLAFIDDDEIASPDWLENLLAAQRGYQADVVLGPTRARLDPDLPAWLRQVNERSHLDGLVTGQPVPAGRGGAGNLLIRRGALAERGSQPFDPALTRTGGEDGDFFNWVRARGGRVVWCAEACAWEELAAERYRVSYYVRRSLTFSAVHWRELYRKCNPLRVASLAMIGAGMVAVFGSAWLLALPAGRRYSVPLLLAAVRGLGRVLALTGLHIPLYGTHKESGKGRKQA